MKLVGKKGSDLVIDKIIEAIILSVFIFGMLFLTYGYLTKSIDWQEFYTRDVALTIDLMHASPGDLKLGYVIQKELITDIKEDRVSEGLKTELVGDVPLVDTSWMSFPYGRSGFIMVQDYRTEATFFNIYRSGNRIFFEEEAQQSSTCPEINTEASPAALSFYIKEPNRLLVEQSQKTSLIAAVIQRDLERAGLTFNEQNPVLTMELRFSDRQGFTLFYNGNIKAEKLACLQAEYLREALKDVIPSVRYEKASDDALSIVIDLGSEDNYDSYKQYRTDIGGALAEGVLAYYGIE